MTRFPAAKDSAIGSNCSINCLEGFRVSHNWLTSTSVPTQSSPKQGYWVAVALYCKDFLAHTLACNFRTHPEMKCHVPGELQK
jgi:hypothetical protein